MALTFIGYGAPSCLHPLNLFGAVWFPTNMGGIFHGSVSEEKKDIFLLISHISLTATENLYGAIHKIFRDIAIAPAASKISSAQTSLLVLNFSGV